MRRTLAVAVFLIVMMSVVVLPLNATGPESTGNPSRQDTADAHSDIDKAKARDIRKLLVLKGAKARMVQVMDQMTGSLKKAMPQVPAKFWVEFRKNLDPDELLRRLVPIYDRHYTHHDIKAMIAFYQSPVGQKVVKEQHAVLKESMAVGRKYGRRIGRRAMRKIRARQLRGSRAGSGGGPAQQSDQAQKKDHGNQKTGGRQGRDGSS